MNRVNSIIWGVLLILIGIIFGINALGIATIDIFFSGWWTLFIIIPSFIGLFNDRDKTGNVIGLMVGVLLFLACQDIINFEILWKLLGPVILIIIGLSIIFKDLFTGKIKKEIKKLNKNDNLEYSATFGGQDLDFSKEEFTGCDLSAVFGGIKCDLREAKIDKDVVINTTSIFGGIDIYVPKSVKVKVSSVPVFGGVSDERKNKNKDAEVTVYINATCMFGGVSIYDKRSKDD